MNRVSLLAAGLLMMAILAPLAWGIAPGTMDDTLAADGHAAQGAAEDEASPVGPPTPITGSTLPNSASTFSPLIFDDFEWCTAPPCSIAEADPQLYGVQGFGYSVMPAGGWVVSAGGVGGGHAVHANTTGSIMQVEVRAASDLAGSPWLVSFAAKGPVLGGVEALDALGGGLEVRVSQRVAGLIVGPLDCAFVPVVPESDGFSRFVPTNPACLAAPHTTQVWIEFRARGDAAGVLPTLAIDDILVERV